MGGSGSPEREREKERWVDFDTGRGAGALSFSETCTMKAGRTPGSPANRQQRPELHPPPWSGSALSGDEVRRRGATIAGYFCTQTRVFVVFILKKKKKTHTEIQALSSPGASGVDRSSFTPEGGASGGPICLPLQKFPCRTSREQADEVHFTVEWTSLVFVVFFLSYYYASLLTYKRIHALQLLLPPFFNPLQTHH